MTVAERLLHEAKTLPPDELEWLVHQLWSQLDGEPPFSGEWMAEVERRKQVDSEGKLRWHSLEAALEFYRGERTWSRSS